MPDLNAMTLEASKKVATSAKTALANSTLRLFKSGWIPSITSSYADFQAHEADYSGYSPVTITAMLGPVVTLGGWSINTPLPLFQVAAGGVTNEIGGMYLVDATENVWAYVAFESPVFMSVIGQAIQRPITLLFPTM